MLSEHPGTLQLVSWACSDLCRCFFYFCFLARSLSWLPWDPRVLGKHLGTRYNCSPGMPRSSPLVFLRLPYSLAVSPGSPGVLGCLASTWGLSTIAPRACRALRRWLFTNLLARWLVGPHLALPPPCSKHTGKIAGIYLLLPLNDLANLKAAGLSQTAYDFTLVCHFVDLIFSCSPSPGLLSAWRPRVLSKQLGSLQLLPSAFTTRFLARGLSWLCWGPLGA